MKKAKGKGKAARRDTPLESAALGGHGRRPPAKPAAPVRRVQARALARKTVEMPAPHVTAPRPLGPPKAGELIDRARRTEGIEAAYEIWQELREHHTAALVRLHEERRKLEQQGEFVLGAVRAARNAAESAEPSPLSPSGERDRVRGPSEGAPESERKLDEGLHRDSASGALVPRPPPHPGPLPARGEGDLDSFLGDASKKLEQAKRELEAAAAASAEKWEASFAAVRAEVRARVQRQLQLVKPKLRLRVRALAGDKRILHVDRPSADEAVQLCFLFTGKLPSRYGYLFDDSTDDLRETPPTLYAEEGVLPAHVRPDPHALDALLEDKSEVIPLKGMLPLRLPMMLRLLERGPVMEAEVADGTSFRNVLSRDEAERIAGHLLKLKLEGWIQLELLAE